MTSRVAASAASAVSVLTMGVAGLVAVPTGPAPEVPVALDHRCAAELAEHLHLPSSASVLGCDHRDRGRAVIAFGDPVIAERLVVLVPGAGTALDTLLHPPAGDGGARRARVMTSGPATCALPVRGWRECSCLTILFA